METQETKIKTEIQTLTEGAEFLSVTTRPEYEALCKQEDCAVAFKKQVEDYWNPLVKKAHEVHKDLTSKRGEMLKPLEAFLATVKRVGGAYLAQEQIKAQGEAAALQKQAEEMGLDTSMIPQAEQVSAGEGRTAVETHDYEVTDESLIPRQFLTLDHKAIKAVVVALKDKTQIPGIRVIKNTGIRRTGK